MIRILPPHVSAMIAAGEVIERPASVVRELVENALDAGATTIDITIPNKSFRRIVVADNGRGMPPEDLALAAINHATSKLPGDDIFNVRTLGFRGEALPSMAAMADLTIVSRPADQDVAFILSVRDGKPGKVMPSAGGFGTRIEVDGLFDAHPVRKAFLKSPAKELAYVITVVDNIALAHPAIRFSLRVDKMVTTYRPQPDFEGRIRDVRGDPLAKNAIPVSHRSGDITIDGLISLPTVLDTKGVGHLDVIVNDRLVSDRMLSAAVQSVYRALTGTQARPFATLRIALDPRRVNLNVHPTKAEVRLRDEGEVVDAVRTAVEQALSQSGLRSPSTIADLAKKLAMSDVPSIEDSRRKPLGQYKAQLNSSWIIAETVDGLVIVDQHAAHERLVLERLKKAAAGFLEELITLPSPVERNVDPVAAASVADCREALSSLGFDVVAEGRMVRLAGYPSALSDMSPEAILDFVLEHSALGTVSGLIGDALWERLATAACKAAIKAGHTLSDERGETLLREIEATPNASQCNHGRPTVIFLTNEQVGKLFERS